jgi:endonuclease/exonuclease/phosphatase family metal-dependent hydrolase
VSRLRIASFNLLSGRSIPDGTVDPGRLKASVAALAPDVLAVQEVDRGQPRSHHTDQPALIAAEMGAVASRFVPTVLGTPGRPGWTRALWPTAEEPGRPTYGVALLSRLPVAEWHVLRLDPAPGRFPLFIASSPPQFVWLHDEPRAVVAAVLEHPRITVAGGHLSFAPGKNVAQLREVRRWLSQFPGPRILMGDLNLPGALPRRITGWTPLVASPTFPSPAPRLQLDHVLADALPRGTAASGRAVRLPVSDHQAVTVDLTLPDSRPDSLPDSQADFRGDFRKAQ